MYVACRYCYYHRQYNNDPYLWLLQKVVPYNYDIASYIPGTSYCIFQHVWLVRRQYKQQVKIIYLILYWKNIYFKPSWLGGPVFNLAVPMPGSAMASPLLMFSPGKKECVSLCSRTVCRVTQSVCVRASIKPFSNLSEFQTALYSLYRTYMALFKSSVLCKD